MTALHLRAISDNRIVACDDTTVTYRYTPSGDRRAKTRTVRGEEFTRGFLQHTLPRGLQKIRYYGWLSPNHRIALDEVKWLVWLFLGWAFWLGSGHAPPEKLEAPLIRCAACGGAMQLIAVSHEPCRALVEHATTYLDSG